MFGIIYNNIITVFESFVHHCPTCNGNQAPERAEVLLVLLPFIHLSHALSQKVVATMEETHALLLDPSSLPSLSRTTLLLSPVAVCPCLALMVR
jgi:hypothetical protein